MCVSKRDRNRDRGERQKRGLGVEVQIEVTNTNIQSLPCPYNDVTTTWLQLYQNTVFQKKYACITVDNLHVCQQAVLISLHLVPRNKIPPSQWTTKHEDTMDKRVELNASQSANNRYMMREYKASRQTNKTKIIVIKNIVFKNIEHHLLHCVLHQIKTCMLQFSAKNKPD